MGCGFMGSLACGLDCGDGISAHMGRWVKRVFICTCSCAVLFRLSCCEQCSRSELLVESTVLHMPRPAVCGCDMCSPSGVRVSLFLSSGKCLLKHVPDSVAEIWGNTVPVFLYAGILWLCSARQLLCIV